MWLSQKKCCLLGCRSALLTVCKHVCDSLAVVECAAVGLETAVGMRSAVATLSVLGTLNKPEALSKVFLQATCDLISFEEPAVGLRWVLACLLLGLCMSVGWKVGVLKLCSCGGLSRVVCARKGSRKRRLPRKPKRRIQVWNRWMHVEVACARMMRVRREPAVVKLGNALRRLAEEMILEAVSRVLMGVNLVLRLLACVRRKVKAWFFEILPFEIRWKSRYSRECELCLGLPVQVEVEDSDEELIPDPFPRERQDCLVVTTPSASYRQTCVQANRPGKGPNDKLANTVTRGIGGG